MSEYPRVAIVGIGQGRHAPRRGDVDYAEFALEAVDEALADAGLELNDVEHAVTAALDFVDGRTIANMSTAEVVGSYLKPEARLCGDGTNALLYALARMRTGAFSIGLVVAHAKESHGRPHIIENAAFDPFYERDLEPDDDVVSGLSARRFYELSGATPQDAARAVVHARAASHSNPRVVDLPEVTVEDVLSSPTLATPLRELDKAPVMDGSAALVVATEETARTLEVDPVWVGGAAVVTGAYWPDRDLSEVSALEAARRQAASMAGWGDDDPVDVVELSARYAYQVLQFAPTFGASLDDDEGPGLNPSGGRLGGSPVVVTGLDRVVEAVHQLRGTAGARQVAAAERAFAHGFHGLGAQTHGVVGLEGDG